MKSVELEHEGLEIKFYETTSEQAKELGFKASKPLLLKHISVDKIKRNRGNGKALLEMIQEYAEKNKCDLIMCSISQDAEFTKDETVCFLPDVEIIKWWLHRNGYAINPDNNDFHKVIKLEKPLKFYGGIGFNNCAEIGNYSVSTELSIKKFSKLSEAKLFYETVKGEKSIWNLDIDELIDSRYRL